MIVAVLGIVGVVAFLMRPLKSAPPPAVPPPQAPDKVERVRVSGPGRIAITVETSFQKQLSIATLRSEGIADPALSVSGSILGRVRPGPESLEDRWQFSSAELSTNYADWLRVNTDTLDDVRKWVARDRIPYPVYYDAKGEMNKLYGLHSYPKRLLIDRNGNVVWEDGGWGVDEGVAKNEVAIRNAISRE